MAKKPTIHSLSKESVPSDENEAFFEELISSSDRASALIGCAGVDAALVQALRCKCIWLSDEMIDDFFYGQKPVLGSFSFRIRSGYILGLYDKKFNNTLDILRRIRNVFAHAMRPINFEHELIAKECDKLPHLPTTEFDPLSSISEHRRQYVRSCAYARLALLEYTIEHLDESLKRMPTIAGL